jgi:hypothetical protein
MKRTRISLPLSLLALGAAFTACGGGSFSSQTANIAGDYSFSFTTGANVCEFTGWTPGSVAMDVPVMMTQQGTSATATVTGLAAMLLLDAVLGTHEFQGTVSGDSFTLTAFGSTSLKDGDCAFTIKATMTGSISAATVQGQITYTETTNGNPACGYHATCSSVQSFAGVRAPSDDAG